MTDLLAKSSPYIEQFARAEQAMGADGAMAAVRRSAMDRFVEMGFPTMRQEDWRFTNPAPIAKTPFTLAARDGATIDADALAEHILDSAWPRLVFVNGYFSVGLSSLDDLPGSIRVGSLAAIPGGQARAIEAHLARHADYQADPFIALNTAFNADGAVVEVPAGVVCDRPVHVLYISVPGAEPQVSHPRGLIIAEPGSQVTVIETYLGIESPSGTGVYFTNGVSEIVAGDNAAVDHYKVIREGQEAYHVGTTHIRLARDTSVSSHAVTLGGALVRNNVTTVLDGQGAHCTLNGLYVMRDHSHVDNHLLVEHVSPHCDSRQFYKGILDGHARAVFTGRINVHKDAQKTDAKQTNMNLLLSEHAQVDTKPQLEIFADDVKCTHGATIGQIDEHAIFYLQSRGIDEATARGVLVFAFAGESLQRVRPEPLRQRLQDVLYDLLPQGHLLREAT